ncbi:MAG: 2-oxoacid:acceptor oxidoreductase family protein, partial [Methanofastidiosum sp.]
MIEIRFHGRGGQGAVVASTILADAAFREGKYVQAFPYFGVERRGAPVTSFTRIDKNPIKIRSQVYTPNYIVVLDPTLMEVTEITSGLSEGGVVLINSDKDPKYYNLSFKT